jgi:CubicO group peptidase (beta-lactamase class C family)
MHSSSPAVRRALIALALLVSSTSPARAQQHAVAPAHPAVDAMFAVYAQPGRPGASVVVIRDGRVAYERSFGLAEVETGRAVTPATDFRLASLSKQFTATAVMLLVADGKLRYDDSLGAVLPGLPAYAHAVTLRQLLGHTGGLPDYEDLVPEGQTAQLHDADIPALLARAPAAKFPAGTRWDYSNTGYVLLALVVERASGARFGDFLRDRIFVPLGMTHTVALEEGRTTVPERAYGYAVSFEGGVRRTDQSVTSATLGDGGIYSNVHDLALWDRALERHTLVSAEQQRLAWTPGTLADGTRTGYGFGWFVDQDHGTTRLLHHGESRGFTNAIVRYPERRLTVIVLTNRTGGWPWDIAQAIADAYLGK